MLGNPPGLPRKRLPPSLHFGGQVACASTAPRAGDASFHAYFWILFRETPVSSYETMTRPNEPHSQPDDPATLVRSVLAGEAGAFERMVRDYTPMLLARLRAKVSDAFEQQDLLQEVFLTAHRRLEALR